MTTDTTTSTIPAWRGWYRRNRRHPWRVIAEGGDKHRVHDEMIDRSPAGDLLRARARSLDYGLLPPCAA